MGGTEGHRIHWAVRLRTQNKRVGQTYHLQGPNHAPEGRGPWHCGRPGLSAQGPQSCRMDGREAPARRRTGRLHTARPIGPALPWGPREFPRGKAALRRRTASTAGKGRLHRPCRLGSPEAGHPLLQSSSPGASSGRGGGAGVLRGAAPRPRPLFRPPQAAPGRPPVDSEVGSLALPSPSPHRGCCTRSELSLYRLEGHGPARHAQSVCQQHHTLRSDPPRRFFTPTSPTLPFVQMPSFLILFASAMPSPPSC